MFEVAVNGYIAYASGDPYFKAGGPLSMLFRTRHDAETYSVLAQAWHNSLYPSCLIPGTFVRVLCIDVFRVGSAVISASNDWRWDLARLRASTDAFSRWRRDNGACNLDAYDLALAGERMAVAMGLPRAGDARVRCCFCRCCANSALLTCCRCFACGSCPRL